MDLIKYVVEQMELSGRWGMRNPFLGEGFSESA